MAYIMGVDGGNSKTYTVITDDKGNKLGEGLTGCGNHQVGLERAMKNIESSIQQALKQADLKPSDIDFVQYGLAGADRETDLKILRPQLSQLPFAKWDVVCDTMEGLRTGSPKNIGVVLICGSGTNAAGRNFEGKTVQTGGFGYLYGDGRGVGGQSLAIEAFRAAIRSWERREEPTLLTETVPSFLGFNSVEAMFHGCLDQGVTRIPADLSIILHDAAAKGDKVAIRILQEAGQELGIAAVSVIRRLGGFEGTVIPIVMVGSVVQKGRSPHLINATKAVIEKEGYAIKLRIPKMAPVYGAVLLGMDQLGIEVSQEVEEKFIQYGGYQDEKE